MMMRFVMSHPKLDLECRHDDESPDTALHQQKSNRRLEEVHVQDQTDHNIVEQGQVQEFEYTVDLTWETLPLMLD